MAAGILILWECYVIEVTVINYLLATGTAASPVETLTSHPYCLPCPYPAALTPIGGIYPWRLGMMAENSFGKLALDSASLCDGGCPSFPWS